MAHLIVPMEFDGDLYCCDPATRRTTALLSGAASEIAASEWEVFHASAWGDPSTNPNAYSTATSTGAVKFGVCCASEVVLELTGQMETLSSGFDWIEIKLNGTRVYFQASVSSGTDPWDTESAGPVTVTLELTDRPCGHVIEIIGSTGINGGLTANNDVWWRAKIISIC